MKDEILKELDKCVIGGTYNKERMMFAEHQYWAGEVAGIAFCCAILGMTDEKNLAQTIYHNYPFSGKLKKKINPNNPNLKQD